MARTEIIKVEEVVFDKEIYPREIHSWHVAHVYSQSMLAGAKFPPIVVALFDGKYYLIDGMHRLTACKSLKIETIQADILEGLSKKQMFEEAIKRNVTHGYTLTPYDKRKVALKLRLLKYGNMDISTLLQVPIDKLDNFISQRLVNSITGETVGESFIVKSGLKHIAGTNVNDNNRDNILEMNKKVGIPDQIYIIRQLLELLNAGLVDKENQEVRDFLNQIKLLL